MLCAKLIDWLPVEQRLLELTSAFCSKWEDMLPRDTLASDHGGFSSWLKACMPEPRWRDEAGAGFWSSDVGANTGWGARNAAQCS